MDSDIIQLRIKSRSIARDLILLVSAEANLISPDAIDVFWDEIRKSIPQLPVDPSDRPMTNEEARAFGLSTMPFGEFKGWNIWTVPMIRLEWYSDSKFQKQLVRYLNSPDVKRLREAEDDI